MPGLDSGKHLSRREDDNYFSAVRGSWPVDDDTLLMAGRGASLYGASPDQAAVVIRAARGNFCTQAPG